MVATEPVIPLRKCTCAKMLIYAKNMIIVKAQEFRYTLSFHPRVPHVVNAFLTMDTLQSLETLMHTANGDPHDDTTIITNNCSAESYF